VHESCFDVISTEGIERITPWTEFEKIPKTSEVKNNGQKDTKRYKKIKKNISKIWKKTEIPSSELCAVLVAEELGTTSCCSPLSGGKQGNRKKD
jgi:hypothetical protein